MTAVYWLIAIIVLLVIEAVTMGLTTIWFAGGALAAFIACVAGAELWLQVVLFIVISLMLLFFYQALCEAVYQQGAGKDKCGGAHRKRSACDGEDRQQAGNRGSGGERTVLGCQICR